MSAPTSVRNSSFRKHCTGYFSIIEDLCEQRSAGFRSHSFMDIGRIVCKRVHIHKSLRVPRGDSRERTFDAESMRAFKSLKVYKYHADVDADATIYTCDIK